MSKNAVESLAVSSLPGYPAFSSLRAGECGGDVYSGMPTFPKVLGRTFLVASSGILALVATMLLLLPASAQEGGVSLPIGSEAPSAMVEDLDGNSVDLKELVAGRPALVEFWASWCENCEALQPQLDELHERYGDELAIVAVAVAVAQTRRRVRRHRDEHGVGYPYVWDATGAAVRAYDALTTSIVVMLDREGRIAYTGVGPRQELVTAAERILEGGGAS